MREREDVSDEENDPTRVQGASIDIEALPRDIKAVCHDCGETVTWREAQTHLCHYVNIVVHGLLPRNDIDINDPEIVQGVSDAVKEAVGLEEVTSISITRTRYGNRNI